MISSSSPIIVTGMHRSGTSLMASLLPALSVNMGQRLLPQDANNRRGYFEDVEFLELQRKILSECCAAGEGGHTDWGWTENESLDRDCFKRFIPQAQALVLARADTSARWGWKDPRTTLLLNFWDELIETPRYIFVYRFPWDVTDSMQRLGAEVFLKNPEYGYRIWKFYNERIRDFYAQRRDRCLLVSINALREKPREFAQLLSDKLGIDASEAVIEAAIEEVFERDMLKAVAGADPLIDLVAAIWPDCARLLSELDEMADISGAGLWQARPVSSRLARPDSKITDERKIDISVVTPCYEQGVLLVEAIASVERFAPPNCELIIVNDGSRQPRTLEILELLKRCGYFVLDQHNAGLAAARNAAIDRARGRYILPLDDDNRIAEGFIEEAIKTLDSSPEVGVVYGDRYDFGLRSGVQQIPAFDLAALMKKNYIDACAVFRKQVWSECGGYDPQVSPMEDWELWIHAAERGWLFHKIPRVTFDYRVRPDSLISRIVSVEILEGFRKKIRARHSELYWRKAVEELEAVKQILKEQTQQERSDKHPAIELELQFLRAQLAAREREIKNLVSELQFLRAQLAAREREVKNPDFDMDSKEREAQTLTARVAELEAQLAVIKSSLGWRLLSYYGRLKYRYLLPVYRLLGALPPEPPPEAPQEISGSAEPREGEAH